MLMTDWDARFLSLTHMVASWSKDPSTKVGAAIVRPDKTIASLGFNGFPRGVYDHIELLNDRNVKYLRTVHAEVNAIITAREPLHGYTLYVAPLYPCANCAAIIIQAGIKHVVACVPSEIPERWAEHFNTARELFEEAGVTVTTLSPVG
jgi:dCMP deaminase